MACGYSLDECHLVTVGFLHTIQTVIVVPPSLNIALLVRGFNNLLLPVGIPPKAWVGKKIQNRSPTDPRTNVIGYTGGKLVNPVTHPIRLVPTQLIKTDKGMRYILPSEWGRLKSISRSEAAQVIGTRILEAVSSNVWALAIFGLEKLLLQSPSLAPPVHAFTSPSESSDFNANWRWSVQDLSPQSDWYHTCVANLHKIVSTLPDLDFWLRDDMTRIATQASNFGPDGLRA